MALIVFGELRKLLQCFSPPLGHVIFIYRQVRALLVQSKSALPLPIKGLQGWTVSKLLEVKAVETAGNAKVALNP
jgi:hypothetical protein